ncbi:MAG: hypothetical protein RJB13_2063, partial [Pseudomonadota bacterium]
MHAALINTHKRGVALGVFSLNADCPLNDSLTRAAAALLAHGSASP